MREVIVLLSGASLTLGCLSSTEMTGVAAAAAYVPPSIESLDQALVGEPDCAGFEGESELALSGERPEGWASVEALGLTETTGGEGGDIVTARTYAELETFAESDEPLIIQVCGLLGAGGDERLNLQSNKTLIGVGNRPTLQSTLNLSGVQNVIVRNLLFRVFDPTPSDTPDDLWDDTSVDGVTVRRSSHIWLDHLDISNSTDGNMDISDQSNYVTVSWTRFWYPTVTKREGHRFSNLVGSSDSNPADEGTLKVSMHHNWWGDRVRERMPRTRYGDIHVYNNLYTSADANYCVRAGIEARLLVEANYFRQVDEPIDFDGGTILERDNVFERVTNRVTATEDVFEPPYAYDLNDAASLPEMIVAGAGAVLGAL